jgi:FlaA1/EpsC-like NDP-sugar epimerase
MAQRQVPSARETISSTHPMVRNRIILAIQRNRRPIVVLMHLVLIVASSYLSLLLRFDGKVPQENYAAWLTVLPALVAFRAIMFVPFRLYQGIWRYTSIWDLRNIVAGVGLTSATMFAVMTLFPVPAFPRSVLIIDAVLLVSMMSGLRLARRVYRDLLLGGVNAGRRILIFGAGDAGELIVRDMKNNPWYDYQPIGFIDDDREKVGGRIHGVRVLGTRNDLVRVLERERPDEVLIAIPTADPAAVRSIVRLLEPFKVPIKTLPNLRDIFDGTVEVGQIRNLAVEDLLVRAPIGLDRKPLQHLIAGRRVMVTGAGGSIGSELCRQIATLKPASLVMYERYENSLHAIRLELEDQKLRIGLHPIVGDVTDAVRVDEVLQAYRPEIVFHAAAHKHVPLMEENPCEAIKNNVRGTRVLAAAADRCGVDRFILISTDKAVNPTSVMGASKRVAELIVQAQADGSGTSFSVVRFGNVLGSNGSVIPRFMEQIRKGGPVTITDPDMRRFFMLIPEAVHLVLHAASQAETGATYVLDMGEQVKLLDMARDLIRLAGLVPEEDIKIEFIGLRPGEKMYEELVGVDEEAAPSATENVLCVRSRRRLPDDWASRVESLEADAFSGRRETVLQSLTELVGFGAAAQSFDSPSADAVAVAGTAKSRANQRCPRCHAFALHRSHARSIVERIKKEFSDQRLYRCDECGWRGWAVPIDAAGRSTAGQQDVPDLASVDAAIGGSRPVARPTFSPRNLR